MKRSIRWIVALLAVANAAQAQSTAWIGLSSSSWDEDSNWTNGVPDAATHADVGFGAFFDPVVSSTAECASLNVSVGLLALDPGAVLDVYGDVSSQGISGAGIVRTRGTGASALVSGFFSNLEVFDGDAVLTNANVTGDFVVSQATATVSDGSFGTISVESGGTLVAQDAADLGVLSIEGQASLQGGCGADSMLVQGGTATLTLGLTGPIPFDVAGDVQNLGGTVTSPSGTPLRVTASGEVTGALPALRLDGGEQHLFNVAVTGDLLQTIQSSGLLVRDVYVSGDATFLGGDVQDDGPSSILTVDGDATWDNWTDVFAPPRLIRVSGDWTSSWRYDALAPGRRIKLRGGGTRQLSADGRLGELELEFGTTVNAIGPLTVRELVQVNAGCTLSCDELASLIACNVDGELETRAGGNHELRGATTIQGSHVGTGTLTVYDAYTVPGTSRGARFIGPITLDVAGTLGDSDVNPSTGLVTIEGGGSVGGLNLGFQTSQPNNLVILRDVSTGAIDGTGAFISCEGDVAIQSVFMGGLTTLVAGEPTARLTCGGIMYNGDSSFLGGFEEFVLTGSVTMYPTNGFGTGGGIVRFKSAQIQSDAQGAGGASLSRYFTTESGMDLSGEVFVEDGFGVGFGFEDPVPYGQMLQLFLPPTVGNLHIEDGTVGYCNCVGDLYFGGSPYFINSVSISAQGSLFHGGRGYFSIPGPVTVASGGFAELSASSTLGSVQIDPGATLVIEQLADLGTPETIAFAVGDMAVAGNFVCDGDLINPAGIGIEATGSGVLRGSVPALTVTGSYGFESSTLSDFLFFDPAAGNLDLALVPGTAISVAGDVDLLGASLSATATGGSLDVEGRLNWSPTSAAGAPQAIAVGGDATFNATFAPAPASLLRLDGPAAPGQILTHAGNTFQSVTIAETATVTTSSLRAEGLLDVDGSLTLGSGFLIAGDLDVASGASLDLQAAAPIAHTVRGDLRIASGGTLSVPSDAFLSLTASEPRVVDADFSQLLPIVNITAGDTTLEAMHAFIFVTQTTTGSLVVDQLRVDNDCGIRGTTFSGAGPGSLFEADIVLALTPGELSDTPPETIRVGNRLDVNENFAPTSGVIELVGDASAAIRAVENATSVQLHDLRIVQGQRTLEAPLIVNDLTIEAGASLTAASGATITVAPGAAVVVDGELILPQGADLVLGTGASLHVTSSGRLFLDGLTADRSEVSGDGSAILIEGQLDAQRYTFTGMDAAGVQVTSAATVGAAPNDLRGGLFLGGASGGVQLDLSTDVPLTLLEPDFVSGGSGVAVGLRSTTGAPIQVVGALGDVAGEAFEDDLQGVIAWSPPMTQLASFDAVGRVFRVLLSFTTDAEEPALPPFRILRDDGLQIGANIPAAGPSTYAAVDTGLLANVSYGYTLQYQSAVTGAWRWLGEAAATPHADVVGATYFVGPGGFADIDSALFAAPAGSAVFVEAGDYAGFTITQPVQILGDTLGPVRVTGGVPVAIDGVATPTGSVLLHGLEIQSSLQMTNVGDPVLIHDVAVTGAGDPGTVISGCAEVALQRLDTERRVEVLGSTVASWGSTFATVDLSSAAFLQHVDTNPGAVIQADGSSTNAPLSPGWPTIDAPLAWPFDTQIELTFGGTAGEVYIVAYAPQLFYIDLAALTAYDMPLLLSLAPALNTLTSGVLLPGGRGGTAGYALSISAVPALVGRVYLLQILGVDPFSGSGRLGEAVPILFVP